MIFMNGKFPIFMKLIAYLKMQINFKLKTKQM